MLNFLLKKGMVYAVIFLFIASIIVVTIGTNAVFFDQVDQQQTVSTHGLGYGAPFKCGQSFKPTLNTLTRVELICYRTADSSHNLKVSIRSDLYSSDLTSITLPVTDLPVGVFNQSWINFNFTDIPVTPENTYYIVWSYSNSSDFPAWNANNNPASYTRGDLWVYNGANWTINTFYDMCFKTYGYNGENQAEIVIDSIEGGFRSSAVIKNNGTATATDINWSIDLEGGLILAGEHTHGVIAELASGASKTIRQSTLYGIGRTTITVTAGDASKQATGFILGPLVLGVEEINY